MCFWRQSVWNVGEFQKQNTGGEVGSMGKRSQGLPFLVPSKEDNLSEKQLQQNKEDQSNTFNMVRQRAMTPINNAM